MNIKRVLEKYFDSETVNAYMEQYKNLGYADIKRKYRRFLKADNVWKIIDSISVETKELYIALTKEQHHARSSLCQSLVLMILEEEAEKRTASRYENAVKTNNIRELKDIFINHDKDGKFRRNYIKGNS